ncbi:uncharacterized protein LOC120192783 [Hibiscus syriacus]|uniref:uncharacterized protein LOC120192783 n=1 Tax=Hibiscus syriacus TaxID=106335 RepID=UPI0019235A18|nr:uncharacterized protein LOC120192783 [Hibiscus syriacus]
MARAHKLLGSSSHGANYRTVHPRVYDAHSSTVPVIKEETGTELQSGNGKNKGLLEQENPTKKMVIKLGGGFSNSQKKQNYSGTGMSNWKMVTVSSSQKGNSKYWKAETAVRIGCRKERTKARPLMEVGSSRRICANGSPVMKYKYEANNEDEDGYSSDSSIEGKVRMRSLRSVYADLRSRIPSFSRLNYKLKDY